MSEEKRVLHNTIDIMPEEWAVKILAFIETLKEQYEEDIPERLTAKDEDDLSDKLKEAIQDKGSIPLDEVVKRMNKMIAE